MQATFDCLDALEWATRTLARLKTMLGPEERARLATARKVLEHWRSRHDRPCPF